MLRYCLAYCVFLVAYLSPVSAQELATLLREGPISYLTGPACLQIRGNLTAGDGADITWADYDGDGQADLLAGSSYGDLVLYRRAAQDFAPPTIMLTAALPYARDQRSRRQLSPELVDLDGQAPLDLVLGLGAEVYLYRRTASGMTSGEMLLVEGQPLSLFLGSAHVAPYGGDYDADGDTDLLLGDEEGRVWLLERLSEPGLTWAPPRLLMIAGSPLQVGPRARVCLADWDGDNHTDLLLGDANGLLWWAQRLTDGLQPVRPLFSTQVQDTYGRLLFDLCPRLGDLDNDGTSELLLGCRDGWVAVFGRTETTADFHGYLQAREVPIDVGRYAVPTVTDWDADGRTDLLVGAEDGFVRVYLRQAGGHYSAGQIVTAGAAPLRAAAGRSTGRYSWPRLADLNGDGITDLLLGGASGQVAFYLNQGGLRPIGVMAIGGTPVTTAGVAALSLADYDDDGDLDFFLGDLTPPDTLPIQTTATLPRYVLPRGGITYYENEAAKGGGLPVFRKGVRLTLYLGAMDRSRDDAALDAAVLSPYYLEPIYLRDSAWTFLVSALTGCYLFPSTRTRQYYPVPVLSTPHGATPAPLYPPLYSCTAVALDGSAKGLLCGLGEYGFVCYYPSSQVPELSGAR